MRKKFAVALAALLVAVGGVIGIQSPGIAHAGNIKVSNAVCVSADSMKATYTVGWTDGTATGTLYQKPGLLNSPSSWVKVKDVTDKDGSTTCDLTHAKSDFTGTNSVDGPWVSFEIRFTDGNTQARGDTRVEGFDWSKCIPPQPADKVVTGEWAFGEIPCDATTAEQNRTVSNHVLRVGQRHEQVDRGRSHHEDREADAPRAGRPADGLPGACRRAGCP